MIEERRWSFKEKQKKNITRKKSNVVSVKHKLNHNSSCLLSKHNKHGGTKQKKTE